MITMPEIRDDDIAASIYTYISAAALARTKDPHAKYM
jgi:hypothetical protein